MTKKQLRNKVLHVAVTADEERKFKAFAESEHLQIADLVRRVLHQAADAKLKEQAA